MFPQDFGLTIDIEKLIRETDTDGSGKVDYAEFKEMMACSFSSICWRARATSMQAGLTPST